MTSGGRLVIPAKIRRALGWGEGEDLVLQLDGGQLLVSTRKQSRQWACDLVSKLVPDGVDLADELIRERRREAAGE
jgi:AbrB family looped-hinge helix DNA binding protein